MTLLDEAFLRQLERFKLAVRKGLRATAPGEHRSRHSGISPEFLEHRNYQPGDDFRYIDWNVVGRLDRIFIKLFRAEQDLAFHLLLDVSRSMGFGDPPKDHYAKKTAAALAYLGLANLDRVGIGVFNDHLIDFRSPQRGHRVFVGLLDFLQGLQPQGATDFSGSLAEYAAAGARRGLAGLVVIVSDLLDPRGLEKGLDVLAAGHCDAALIHVLDGRELVPGLQGDVIMEDIETGRTRRMTLDRPAAQAHHRAWQQYLEGIRAACGRRGIEYALCDTRTRFEDFLLDFLMRLAARPGAG